MAVNEVRAAGYAGGYGRVRDYVRAVRPRELPEPVVRFETPAGHQGQVDFATFTLPWGRRYALSGRTRSCTGASRRNKRASSAASSSSAGSGQPNPSWTVR